MRNIDKFRVSEGAIPAASTTTRDPLGESCATPTLPRLVVVIVRRGKRPELIGCVHPHARVFAHEEAVERMLSMQNPASYTNRSIERRARRECIINRDTIGKEKRKVLMKTPSCGMKVSTYGILCPRETILKKNYPVYYMFVPRSREGCFRIIAHWW